MNVAVVLGVDFHEIDAESRQKFHR